MLASQIPTKFRKAFGVDAAGANIRSIPVTTADPDAASQSLGWPPATMTAEGAGGVPPDGRDMNGLDNMLSAWALWQSIGGPVPYDSVQQAAIGGYPAQAIVGSVTSPGTYWQSTADNNTTNPDTGGAGWLSWPSVGSVPWASPPPIGNVTPNGGSFTDLTLTGRALVVGAVITGGVVNSGTDLQINGVGFSKTFTPAIGYQKLPSGLIIQCGRVNLSSGSGDTILFPVAFPNSCMAAAIAGGFSSNTSPCFASWELTSNSFLLAWAWLWNGSTFVAQAGAGFGWIAIGY